MKKLLLIIAAFAALSCPLTKAQAQYSTDVEPFHGINLYGPFQTRIVPGNAYRVLITIFEPYRDYVDCTVRAGILSIGVNEKEVPGEVKRQFRSRGSSDPVFTAIIYTPSSVSSISIKDKASVIESGDLFDDSRFLLEMEGSSSVRGLSVTADVLDIDMKGKSEAELSFEGREIGCELNGTASLTLAAKSESASCSLAGSTKLTGEVKADNLSFTTKANSFSSLVGSAEHASFTMSGTSEIYAGNFNMEDAAITMSSVCKLTIGESKALTVDLNGGSALYVTGDPTVKIKNIRSATVSQKK